MNRIKKPSLEGDQSSSTAIVPYNKYSIWEITYLPKKIDINSFLKHIISFITLKITSNKGIQEKLIIENEKKLNVLNTLEMH